MPDHQQPSGKLVHHIIPSGTNDLLANGSHGDSIPVALRFEGNRLPDIENVISSPNIPPKPSHSEHPTLPGNHASTDGDAIPVALRFDGNRLPDIKDVISSANVSPQPSQSEHPPLPGTHATEKAPDVQKPREAKGLISTVADAYFETKAFEKGGVLYRALGVSYFKMVVMGTFGKLNRYLKDKSGDGNNYCLGGHTLKDLKDMEWATRLNESIHIGAILLTNAPSIIGRLSSGETPHGITLAFLAINVYCIILQRFNRERLCKAIDRAEKRPSNRIPYFKLRDS